MRVLWAARTLRHDVPRLLAGVSAFRRHLHATDDTRVGLSVFSTSSHRVTRRARCTYHVAIANLTAFDRYETLRIDVRSAEAAGAPQGLYASFEKRLILSARAGSHLSITFDWSADARFVLGGLALRPDAFATGPCSADGLYVVRATLVDAAGLEHEPLDVLQRLTP